MKLLTLLFHRVNEWQPDPWDLCVSPRHFEEQMEVVSRLSPRPVITFDDGYADNLHSALPVLEKFEIPAHFFIVSGEIGSSREMWWDALEQLYLTGAESDNQQLYDGAFARLRSLPAAERETELEELFRIRNVARFSRPERRMMTETELKLLSSSPLAMIGAHTVSHPVLSSLSWEQQEREIAGSKARLEQLIDGPVDGFAYPNGMPADYTPATLEIVRLSGFSYAYSAFEHDGTDPFQLPRVMIRNWDGDQFQRVLWNAAAAHA